MNIRIIGCGNAFSHLNFNQSFLLEEDGKKLLIDCGTRTPLALAKAKVKLTNLDAIYISHAHSDHCGGLEEVAFLRYDWKNKPRKWDEGNYAPKIIANEKLLEELWNNSLKGGLDSMEGFDSDLATFFEPVPIKSNTPFYWGGWKFDLIQQIHIMTGSMIKNTFGLLMSKEGHKTVYFTTDSQHCSPKQMEIFYKKADIIFQDCECIGVDTKNKVFMYGSGVHASYGQLAGWPSANATRLSAEIKAKMLLSHYQDFVSFNKDGSGNDCNWEEFAKSDGFRGFVKVGDIFEV
jgi:ribonuclease BN (tRNA processing enzyme)